MVIPGASSPGQARQNAAAANMPALTGTELRAIEGVYDQYFRAGVHHRL